MKCPACQKEFGYYSLKKKAWICRHCGKESIFKAKEKPSEKGA